MTLNWLHLSPLIDEVGGEILFASVAQHGRAHPNKSKSVGMAEPVYWIKSQTKRPTSTDCKVLACGWSGL